MVFCGKMKSVKIMFSYFYVLTFKIIKIIASLYYY